MPNEDEDIYGENPAKPPAKPPLSDREELYGEEDGDKPPPRYRQTIYTPPPRTTHKEPGA